MADNFIHDTEIDKASKAFDKELTDCANAFEWSKDDLSGGALVSKLLALGRLGASAANMAAVILSTREWIAMSAERREGFAATLPHILARKLLAP